MLSSNHLPSDGLSKDFNQSSATTRTYCSSIGNSESPTNTEGHNGNHIMQEFSQYTGAGHTSQGSYQFYEFDKLKTLEDESEEPREDYSSATDNQRQNLYGLNNHFPHQNVSNPSPAIFSEDPTSYNLHTEQVSNMVHPYTRYPSQFYPDGHSSNPHNMDYHLQTGGGITLANADHQGSFGITLPRPALDRKKISRRHSMDYYPASVASENGLRRGQLKRDFGSFSTRSATSLDGYNMNMNRFSPPAEDIRQQYWNANTTAAPTIGKDIESDVNDFSDACDKFMENIEIQSLRSMKSSTMNERPGYSLRSVQEDAASHYSDINDVFDDKATAKSAFDIEPIPFEETTSSCLKMPEIKEDKYLDQNEEDDCSESGNYKFYAFYREDEDDDDEDFVYQEPPKPCPIKEECSEGEIMPESQTAKKRRSCTEPAFSIKSERTVVTHPSQRSSHGGLGPDCLGMDLGFGKIGTSAHDPIDSQSIRSLQSSFMNEFKVLSMNQVDSVSIEDSALNDPDMIINEADFDDMKTFEEIENGRIQEELNMSFGDLDAIADEVDKADKVNDGSEEDKTSITSDDPVKDEQSKSGSISLSAEERDLGTSFSNVVLEQFKPTTFEQSDVHGKRKGLKFGFPGLQCQHCELDRMDADKGNTFCRLGGRYFPSSIKTMSDTKKTLMTMHKHLVRCPNCPSEVKQKLTETLETHDEEKKRKKHGSQKAFFLAVWFCLHEKAPKDLSEIKNPRITVERR